MMHMRLIFSALVALVLAAAVPTSVHAQCSGQFPANSVCGTTAAGLPKPVSVVNSNMDVFLVIGDSNAVGQGVAASSATVEAGTVKQYCAAGTISDANDPTCSAVDAARNANTGSIWPTFGVSYYRSTGTKVGFILTGKAGTTQTAAADTGSGNWDAAGALFTEANNALTAGLAAYNTAGFGARLRGIIVHLGANDALAINAATITQANYSAALTAMLARWRTTLSNPSLPIYLIQTGSNIAGGVSDTGYSQVRSAQKTVTTADPYTPLIFLNTLDFVIRGMMSSGAHPTQAGYNETGAETASNIISNSAQQSFQRSAYALYWPHGNVAIGNPLADDLLSINANRQVNAQATAVGESVVHITNVSGTQTAITLDSYGSGPSSYRSRVSGGTITTPTATPNATVIASLLAYGHDGTSFSSASDAAFACATNQLFAVGARGTFCSLQVTPDGTTTKVTSMGWENDGGVTIPRTVTGGTKGIGTINATQIYRAGTVLATVATSASAADLSAGTLPAGRMPALTGDVTTSAGAVATTIANAAVTYAKMQNVAASRLLGNPTGGATAPSEISLGATLAFSGTALQTAAHTGDVTTAANSFATTIANNAVTNAKAAQMPASTIKGNTTLSTANATDLTVAQTNQLTQSGMLKVCSTGMDVSASNTDHALTMPIPSANYRVILALVYNANASLTTATAGIWTGAGGTGLNVATNQALSGVTATTANTTGNALSMTIAGVFWLTSSTLQFRVGTGQAATLSVCIYIDPLD
jgi:hypothetical protein